MCYLALINTMIIVQFFIIIVMAFFSLLQNIRYLRKKIWRYSTSNWSQSPIWGNYARAPKSFIFNLSNSKKYGFMEHNNVNAINKNDSYGPSFGGGKDLYISDQCRPNSNSYFIKSS